MIACAWYALETVKSFVWSVTMACSSGSSIQISCRTSLVRSHFLPGRRADDLYQPKGRRKRLARREGHMKCDAQPNIQMQILPNFRHAIIRVVSTGGVCGIWRTWRHGHDQQIKGQKRNPRKDEGPDLMIEEINSGTKRVSLGLRK